MNETASSTNDGSSSSLRVSVHDLTSLRGQRLGPSAWTRVDQGRINAFAQATGDHQWIHVDAGRAQQGPFGSTIAHGFLTLSLIPVLSEQLLTVTDVGMTVNYGLEKVRFLAPVPADGEVRATMTITSAEPRKDGILAARTVEVELSGSSKPACVAESLALYYPA